MSTDDPFSLAGKRILVTGASSGIGRQVALSCAEMGAELVITGRHEERLRTTAEQLQGIGHRSVAADLTQPAGQNRVLDAAGVLNGVVHAAGISRLVPFRMLNEKHLHDTFSTNTYAPILLTKSLLSQKKIAPKGSIVFIAAVASHIGPMASSAYSGSKAALMGATRSMALEVVKHGIRANCISPGYVRTPLLEELGQGGGSMENATALAPLGLGEPEDVANAAVFFLSDASRWITRNYFVVDGGLTVPMDVYA